MAVQDRGQTFKDARGRPTACSRLFFHPVNWLILADNTWNAYYCEINETVVLDNAKFMNESGLLKAGYEYFVIDGTGPFIPAILVLMSFKTAGWPISDLNQETF